MIPTNTRIPYTDLRPSINRLIKVKWQESWDECQSNKLHKIWSTIAEWRLGYRKARREEVVVARLRIGHTYITHKHLLKGEESPMCISCQEAFTVKHILRDSQDLQQSRRKYYNLKNLKDLFKDTNLTKILDFIKGV